MTRRLALGLALLVSIACRERPSRQPPDAGPSPPGARPADGGARSPDAGAKPPAAASKPAFTLADLAAAAAVDARFARLSALAARYQMEIATVPLERLNEQTRRLDPVLDDAAAEAAVAAGGVSDPRDRALAAPLVAAAGRWPALLRQSRAERLAGTPGPATAGLQTLGESVARALDAYRRSRSGWVLTAPPEDETAVAFTQARNELERVENRIGAALPAGPGQPVSRLDQGQIRAEIEVAVRRGRAAAAVVAGDRRPAAQRWVEAQARSVEALLALTASPLEARQRMERSLAYQDAKADALQALAEYARLAAARAAR
ncbi:MAG TPA: hypothetical protein VFR85_21125 [Anaeromyxobacteraceae bacterium]|nr:hypothetical protein [Anaeromyxobacteraceae bacterium]